MLDATGPSRPRNAGRYRPFASAECWTLPALRVRGMLDATGPSRMSLSAGCNARPIERGTLRSGILALMGWFDVAESRGRKSYSVAAYRTGSIKLGGVPGAASTGMSLG